jgi:hypothetical protein
MRGRSFALRRSQARRRLTVSGRGDRGIVLVAVLFAVAIMSVMVVAASALTRAGIAGHGLEQRRLATHLALRSGLESAKAMIVTTPPELRYFLDGAPLAVDLGGGLEAEVTIRDAAGLPDLNRTELPFLEALLNATLEGADATELYARISEWRSEAAEQAKTERPPQAAKPPEAAAPKQDDRVEAPPAPMIFLSVDQLKALAEPDSANRLAERFTVFNPTGLVNPLAAPDDVLLAIPGFTKGDLAAIAAARKTRAPRPDQSLQPILDRLKPFLALREPTVFMIGIRLKQGPEIIAQSAANAVVQFAEQGPLPFRTLSVSGL